MTAAFDREDEEFGSLLDDVKTAWHWAPILKLVKKLEDSKELPDQMRAAREVVAFAIKTALHKDPNKVRAFLIFGLVCETIESDPRWRAIFEAML